MVRATQAVAFKLTPSANGWTESVVHNFTGGNDGKEPDAGLTRDAAGACTRRRRAAVQETEAWS